MNSIGLVAIGRNEGERLRGCLASVRGLVDHVVYVDSGSTDGSIELARAAAVEVVGLDLSIPFTAARARNEGFARLLEKEPGLQFVQFVDGDCEVAAGWIEHARDVLARNPDLAIVSGRRRERYPDASVYNRICDIEWDAPTGESTWCGGDFMIRAEAFQKVGGLNPAFIAGEEPEMCVRLRKAGYKILRVADEMTVHDAAMTQFKQWWRRNVRTGYAWAEGAATHGREPERYWVRSVRANWAWGLFIPLVALALAWPTRGWSLLLLGLYPLQWARIYRPARQRLAAGPARTYATFCVLGKFAQARGQARFVVMRLMGRKSRLIEYKG